MMTIPEGFADPDGVAGPVTIRQAVAWGELDLLGHVNHTVFLRWIENARIAWFERVGIAASIGARQLGPILARIECDYRMPVEFPDTIWTSARCIEIGRTSLILHSRIWSEQRNAIVAEGDVVVVLIDRATQRSTAIPEVIRSAIAVYDGPRERGAKA